MKTAAINEIFCSYQGEGPYQGMPQVFIRFSGCNLNCKYCDTDHSTYMEYSAEELSRNLVFGKKFHSVSITGGEPLIQSGFLSEFLPLLNQKGIKVYLDTNGTLVSSLGLVLPYVDIISMDIKLPSATGGKSFWHEHKRFLEEGARKEIFVKVVFTEDTLLEDLKSAIDVVTAVNNDIMFVLQPAESAGENMSPSMEKIDEFRQFSLDRLKKVKVIPQMHKLIGIK